MTTFQPATPNWLSAAWDTFSAEDPSLQGAYDLRDYPSNQSGEGNWVDMYLTEDESNPIARLWVNPDTENIGLILLPASNVDYATKCALELRQLRDAKVDATAAYSYIKQQYFAGEEQTGELEDANAGTATGP